MRETKHTEKIWLLGPESQRKRTWTEQLRRLSAQTGREFVSIRQPGEIPSREMEGCRALLFGDSGSCDGAELWQSFEKFSEILLQLAGNRPGRLLFVSDILVYGKLFGRQRLVKEDEIGYAGHTAERDMAAQCLRTEENLCFRLAREEGLNIKIVRADQSVMSAEAPQEKLLETLLGILEDGVPGEVFNLSAKTLEERRQKNEQCARGHSALAPVTVIPDTRKAEKYAAS